MFFDHQELLHGKNEEMFQNPPELMLKGAPRLSKMESNMSFGEKMNSFSSKEERKK